MSTHAHKLEGAESHTGDFNLVPQLRLVPFRRGLGFRVHRLAELARVEISFALEA